MKDAGKNAPKGANGGKKRLSPWAVAAICLASAVLIVLVALLCRYLYVVFINPMSAFSQPTPVPTQTAAPTLRPSALPAATASPTPEPTLSPEEELELAADLSYMQNRVNILLVGWDQSPERTDSSSELYRDESNNFRSDVLMLLTVDFENNTAGLISIPRDTYAPLYKTDGTLWRENSRYKINAAFAMGGASTGEGFGYAVATVSKLMGVPISNYVGVDMQGLKVVVDAMGGVDYDVDVEIHLNGRVLEKGYQHLSGQQVLDYCRARKGISTDVGRADRQQRMLFTIFEQLQSRSQLARFPKIYTSVKDYIHTDLTFEQISALCKFGLTLPMQNLSRSTLGGEYINNTAYNGASYYVLHNEQLKTLVLETFGIEIEPDGRYDVAYVEADKLAAEALQYASAAEYLLNLQGYSLNVADTSAYFFAGQDVLNVVNAVPPLIQAAQRKGEDEFHSKEAFDEYMQQPLDAEAITPAMEALHSALLNYCFSRGINRLNVDKAQLPAALYGQLVDPTAPWPAG